MNNPHTPAGHYVCPNCSTGIDVFVPLSDAPTHRCSALTETGEAIKNKKTFVMEREGDVREGRNRIRRLDASEKD